MRKSCDISDRYCHNNMTNDTNTKTQKQLIRRFHFTSSSCPLHLEALKAETKSLHFWRLQAKVKRFPGCVQILSAQLLLFGRPLFPSDVQCRAVLMIVLSCLLSTCPIQVQRLLEIIVDVSSSLRRDNRSFSEIFWGQKILNIVLKFVVWKLFMLVNVVLALLILFFSISQQQFHLNKNQHKLYFLLSKWEIGKNLYVGEIYQRIILYLS